MGLKLGDKTVLAIGDEPEILDLVKEFPEEHYYRALTAANGPDGTD